MLNHTESPGVKVDRIISLDILRGVAVLGILIMNIQSFSMPVAAYINPTAYGDLNGLNRWVWIFSHILASQKFMSIFSMLFGAGVVIFSENAILKGKNSALLHYRRMGWLLVFGLVHGYLLWYGDILFTYGLCGMLVFLFRNISPKKLIWIGFGFFAVPMLLDFMFAFSMPYWPEEALQSTKQNWCPDEFYLQHYLAAYRGNWLEQMEIRVPGTIFMQTGFFFMQTFWRVMSMMLLGMALFRWGILSAERTNGFYLRLTIIGLLTGILLSALGVVLNFKHGWSMEFSMFLGKQFNYMGSLGTALGYVGLVMLVCKSSFFKDGKKVFSAVGRLAFTNYMLMTLICTYIFYGHGLGLFGSVERKIQILIVLGIWMVLMILSPLWLKKFRYGPLEWSWRRLTYGKWILPVLFIGLLSSCNSSGSNASRNDQGAFDFAFLTDIHLQPEQGAEVGFKWAIREVNKRRPDFVITGGDLVMDVANQTYGRSDSLYNLYTELSRRFKMPVYNTVGNHEVYGWHRNEKGIEQHEEFGKKMFENRLGARYYSFDHKGWHFIILDAIYRKEDGGYTGKIDQEQVAWLAEDLIRVDKATPIAITTHIPFITSAFQLVRGSMKANPEGMVISNSREVLKLFTEYNLRLVLQGHLHYLEDIYVQNQTHFITGGAVCGQWWKNAPESKPEEGFLMIHLEGDQVNWEYVDYGWTPPNTIYSD